jgi:hypothetical protein
MVGGLVTSAFLTLEIIPSIVTYWRYEQLLWERLAVRDPELLAMLKRSLRRAPVHLRRRRGSSPTREKSSLVLEL